MKRTNGFGTLKDKETGKTITENLLEGMGFVVGSVEDDGISYWRNPAYNCTVSIVDGFWEFAEDTHKGFVVRRGSSGEQSCGKLRRYIENSKR